MKYNKFLKYIMALSIEEINAKYRLCFDKESFDKEHIELIDIIIKIFNDDKCNDIHYDLSNSNILNILGLYYDKKKKNYKKAIQYYLMAIDKDNSNAMCNLAMHYEEVKKNYKKAIQYYQMAIDKGNSNAMCNLAMHYQIVKKNYKKAIQYYQMAIDKGNSNAMNSLALYYEIVKKNYKKAIQYYLMAIDKDNLNAMCNLANYYYDIKKDYVKAIKYYLMAIELGDSQAMCNLAFYYEEIEKDYVKAIKYYLMANSSGNSKAINDIKKLSKTKPLELSNSLNSILELDDNLINLKNELNKNKNVIIFNNKKRLFSEINYLIECPICLDNKLNINLDCGHPICVECYPNVKSCYLKCCK